MRVISGSARGTKLKVPVGMQTRPTSDRVREALFSIIQSRFDLNGAKVLDLCAGTGALGIEALSRGASSACFIEINTNALSVLKSNLAVTKFTGSSEILAFDAIKALQNLGKRAGKFNIIFFDPPYVSDLYKSVPDELSKLSLLSVDGLFIVESFIKNVLPEKIGIFLKIDSRTYADTTLNFYVPEDV